MNWKEIVAIIIIATLAIITEGMMSNEGVIMILIIILFNLKK